MKLFLRFGGPGFAKKRSVFNDLKIKVRGTQAILSDGESLEIRTARDAKLTVNDQPLPLRGGASYRPDPAALVLRTPLGKLFKLGSPEPIEVVVKSLRKGSPTVEERLHRRAHLQIVPWRERPAQRPGKAPASSPVTPGRPRGCGSTRPRSSRIADGLGLALTGDRASR